MQPCGGEWGKEAAAGQGLRLPKLATSDGVAVQEGRGVHPTEYRCTPLRVQICRESTMYARWGAEGPPSRAGIDGLHLGYVRDSPEQLPAFEAEARPIPIRAFDPRVGQGQA